MAGETTTPTPDEGGVREAAHTVAALLGCPVAVTPTEAGELRDFLRRFEAEHCFDPLAQPALTAVWLGDLISHTSGDEVVEVTEPLGLRLVVTRFVDRLAVIGPYTARALDVGEAESVLGGLGIGSAALNPYKRYRSRFPIVDSEYALRGAAALAERAGRPAEGYGVRRVVADAGPVSPGAGQLPRSASIEVVNQRYANEEAFMEAVTAGDERRALLALQRLSNVPQPKGYLSTPYLGVTILRIMTRIAAQQAGLPPVTIDAISQTHAQRLHRTRHSPDPRQSGPAVAAMVSEFCRHVHEHRQRPYSRLVSQALDEIELRLSQSISAAELAQQLHVSESQLARRFKAETGRTITEHVAHQRVSVAARLLSTTLHPVRDIAAHVGYPDANYFVKVFRSVHDQTPTEYRRAHSL